MGLPVRLMWHCLINTSQVTATVRNIVILTGAMWGPPVTERKKNPAFSFCLPYLHCSETELRCTCFGTGELRMPPVMSLECIRRQSAASSCSSSNALSIGCGGTGTGVATHIGVRLRLGGEAIIATGGRLHPVVGSGSASLSERPHKNTPGLPGEGSETAARPLGIWGDS